MKIKNFFDNENLRNFLTLIDVIFENFNQSLLYKNIYSKETQRGITYFL